MGGSWEDDDKTPVDSPHGRARGSDQWSFTAPFEGVVPHLYKDSLGFITCGVGFLVKGPEELARFPWKPNCQSAIADYNLVKNEPHEYADPSGKKHVHGAAYYAQFCNAHLSDLSMKAVFASRVIDIRKLLQQDWQLARTPELAQIALVDMAYNLGVGGLSRYVKLREAVLERDWNTASHECFRRGIQEARNVATAQLFRNLAELEHRT